MTIQNPKSKIQNSSGDPALDIILLFGALLLMMILFSGCSRIPIGASGKGYWDQCVEYDLWGIHNVGEAGVSNIGRTTYRRNVNCAGNPGTPMPEGPAAPK